MPDGSDFALVFSRALGKVVVHIRGALDVNTAPALKDRLFDIIDGQGNRQVVLDLRRTSGVDPAGLAVVVNAVKRMDDTAATFFSAARQAGSRSNFELPTSREPSGSLRSGHTPLGAVSARAGDGNTTPPDELS